MKASKYKEYDLNTLRVQVETLQPAFLANQLSMKQQKDYLLMKAEIKNREQSSIDFNTDQIKLF